MSSPDITKKAIEKMSAEEVVKYLNARKNWHGRRYREVCGWWLSVQNTQPQPLDQ